VDKLTSSAGGIIVNLSYDAFGQRRGSNWTGSPSGSDWTAVHANSHRGYTDHEHLDNLSLIHMNGRVYDPTIGRFLSADPLVQAPYNGQSLNRYSYVFNNPLSFTDPSGFESVNRHYCLDYCRTTWSFARDGIYARVLYSRGDESGSGGLNLSFERGGGSRPPGTASPPQSAPPPPPAPVSTPPGVGNLGSVTPGLAAEGPRLSTVGGSTTGQMLTEAFIPGAAYYNLGHVASAEGRYLASLGWHTAGHLEVLGTLATAGAGGVLLGATRGATVAARGAAAGGRFIVSSSGVAVDAAIAGRWAQGTFGNVVGLIEYHFAKHGAGRTIQQYTDDAARFFERYRDQAQWGKWNPNWQESFRLRVGNQGGYYTADGKILTYWD